MGETAAPGVAADEAAAVGTDEAAAVGADEAAAVGETVRAGVARAGDAVGVAWGVGVPAAAAGTAWTNGTSAREAVRCRKNVRRLTRRPPGKEGATNEGDCAARAGV